MLRLTRRRGDPADEEHNLGRLGGLPRSITPIDSIFPAPNGALSQNTGTAANYYCRDSVVYCYLFLLAFSIQWSDPDCVTTANGGLRRRQQRHNTNKKTRRTK